MWRPGSLLSVTIGALGGVSRWRKPKLEVKPRLRLVRLEDQLRAPRWDWLALRVTYGRRIVTGLVLLGLTLLILWESRTSWIEAALATRLNTSLTYTVAPGRSPSVTYPKDAPYDTTLGYARIPGFIRRLGFFGYNIKDQVRLSAAQQSLVDAGLSPVYQEKSVYGLNIQGADGASVSASQYPTMRYQSLADVPSLVTLSLLFIEDRHLLDRRHISTVNPAISWERLSKATLDLVLDRIFRDRNVPGGSTLATQIEKFRHSPEGRTKTPADKLKQMASATIRAYLLGSDTRAARERIILDYINEVPLGAVPRIGEVKGLGEALKVWFGADFQATNAALRQGSQGREELTPAALKEKASAFKKVLALFLSQRRPAYYLQTDQKDLETLANSYIRVMQKSGFIDLDLATQALQQPLNSLPPKAQRIAVTKASFLERKATNAIRVDLKKLLGVGTLYELDRLDLKVASTFHSTLQRQVSEHLVALKGRDFALKSGIFGERMLRVGQESMVDYSFMLMERKDDFNAVRVQTDTVDSPLDLNRGGKLELGSTAKLRTLLTYLEMTAELHGRFVEIKRQPEAGGPSLDQALVNTPEADTLSRWVIEWLKDPRHDDSLEATLQAALARTFSASPWQGFRTGGGMMTFGNFDPEENAMHLSVLQAFQRSNNLVFVRVMQEIVNHVVWTRIPDGAAMLENPSHPKRKLYLANFVELEGTAFIRRFFRDFAGKSTDERIAQLAAQRKISASRYGALLLSLRPDLDYLGFRIAILEKFSTIEDKVLQRYWSTMRPGVMSLIDRAFVARVHPIALWMVRYLDQNPKATQADVLFDSLSIRALAYGWLTDKAGPKRQARDIWTMLEREAFQRHILPYWHRQGFPFAHMVPSLASALGSSGDRPTALADLMGAINNYGVLMPSRRIEELRFGKDTPYETAFAHTFAGARRVVRLEVAAAAQTAIRAVVEGGTARRLKGTLRRSDGTEMPIAAKTGTGDNRLETYGPGGRLIRSDAKSRTATLVFALGEKFFGVITAYVRAGNTDVDEFAFTSSLVVQVLRSLMPTLTPEILKVEDPLSLAFLQGAAAESW